MSAKWIGLAHGVDSQVRVFSRILVAPLFPTEFNKMRLSLDSTTSSFLLFLFSALTPPPHPQPSSMAPERKFVDPCVEVRVPVHRTARASTGSGSLDPPLFGRK